MSEGAKLSVEQLMPWENKGEDSEAGGEEERLFDALGSDLDELGDEEPPTKRSAALESEKDDDAESDEDEDEAPDEGDEDLDEDDESDDEAEEDEGDDSARTYRVKVDGEEIEVTEKELLEGYSRTADYTRKTQDLSTREKTVVTELSAKRDDYATRLEMLEKALDGEMGPEPDWAALEAEDPSKMAVEFAKYQRKQREIGAVRDEIKRVQTERAQEIENERVETLDREYKALRKAIPEWSNPEVAKAEAESIREYVHGLGFTDDDIKNVLDHRLMLIIRDGMRYRKQQKGGKEKLRDKVKKAKVLKPGGREAPVQKGQRRGSRKALSRAANRLAESHSIDDAAAAIEHLLD